MSSSSCTRARVEPPPTADGNAGRPAVNGGVRLALRRRQRIALQQAAPDHVYVVETGCLTLDAVLPQERRQVSLILYAGDVMSRAAAPPVTQIGLTAMLPSMVHRIRAADLTATVAGAAPGIDVAAATARLAARSSLHTIAIGRLTGEERIATLLLEMALYLGRATPGGHTFEVPLSRNDMADYIALNPDTLSRLVSRLRATGLVSMPSRSRANVRDLAALEAMTPLAGALRELRGEIPAVTA